MEEKNLKQDKDLNNKDFTLLKIIMKKTKQFQTPKQQDFLRFHIKTEINSVVK